MDSRALKCIFMGFKSSVKGYKIMDLTLKCIFLSCDVVFYADVFRLKNTFVHSSVDSLVQLMLIGYFDDVFPVSALPTSDLPFDHPIPHTSSFPISTGSLISTNPDLPR